VAARLIEEAKRVKIEFISALFVFKIEKKVILHYLFTELRFLLLFPSILQVKERESVKFC
jgi:hypothetical protein